MPKNEKREFIRQNQHLPLEELSARTGLSLRRVRRVLEWFQEEAKAKSGSPAPVKISWRSAGWALLPVLLAVLVYLPSLGNGFVNWDDPGAIQENLHIRRFDGPSLKWMFTTFHLGNWIPLTWLSLGLDYHLGQLDPRVYHLDNILLHAVNTALVFFLSLRILRLGAREGTGKTGTDLRWAALLTSALFASHPLQVESVAWATERKGLLCAVFFLSSLWVYLGLLASGERKGWKWGACLVLFALALMAKPMAVTLPLVLVVLDAWPLGRIREGFFRLLAEKIPFFALSLASGLVTVAAQSHAGALQPVAQVALDFRFMNAFHSLMFYIGKLILPLDLTALYPILPGAPAFSIQNFAGVLGVFCVSTACFIYRKERPYLAAAWLYYVLALLPVLGVLQVGAQAAADRYAYLPGISLFLLFSAGVTSLFSGQRLLLTGVGGVAALALGWGTVRQTAVWKDPVTLWENVVRVFPEGSQVAHGNLANAYKAAGRLDEALQEYDKSIAIPPPHAYPHDGKGTLLFDRGFPEEAIREFKTSIALDPAYASPHRNLWFVYEKKGMHEEALKEVLEAIRIDPDFAEAYNNLAISYGAMGDFRRSEEASRKALSLDPANAKYIVNLATTYQRAEKYDEAIALYRKALELNSTDPVYFFNLGNTYLLRGMVPEAIEMIRAALRLQPGNPGLYRKLGEAYERSGQRELAAENYAKARELTAGSK